MGLLEDLRTQWDKVTSRSESDDDSPGADRALSDIEERMKLAFKGANLGYWDWNVQTGELIINEQWSAILGYHKSEIASHIDSLKKLMHPEDRKIEQKILKDHFENNIDYEPEFRMKSSSGHWKWIRSRGKVVERDENGDPLRMLGIIFDITDRKQTQEALLRETKFNETLVHSSPAFFIVIEENGTVRMMNDALLTALGFDSDDIVGFGLEDFIPRRDIPKVKEALKIMRKMACLQTLEHHMVARNGREYLVEWRDQPIFNENGDFDFFFAMGIDITDRRKAENERRELESQIQKAQKLESLGVLAGGIAHDFNNLLMSILGNASLTLMDLPASSPLGDHIVDIETAARRAADLSRQMLAYSGKGQFVIERLDLKSLVEEISQLLEVSVSKKAILIYNFSNDTPAIEADATQIRQIIMNLITNASEAIEDHAGMITCATGLMKCDAKFFRDAFINDNLPAGEYAYFEISDTGCGMDEETQSKIFDPFFTTKFTGRGLGLAAALGIVRGHKGTLTVHSEKGKGTVFRVLFPAVDKIVTLEEEQAIVTSNWRGNGTILLVDDEVSIRAVGERMLRRLGFNVLTANNGRKAIDIFRERNDDISCVLLDLSMPFMGGEETFRKLRQIQQNIPVVLTSGYHESEVADRFKEEGLASFIQKPYQYDSLAEKIKAATAS